MQRILRVGFVGLAVMVVTVGWGAALAGAQQQIGPDQHFIGLVNGSNDHPVVYVVCPGPQAGRKGAVVGGQKLSVAEVADGAGYTGPFSQVYAWFAPTRHGATPRQFTFTTYGKSRALPTSLRVPCEGEGTVVFSSCPYLAPCAAGWVADDVTVEFANIAD